MPGHTLSLDIPHSIKVDNIHYWPSKNIQGAQHININSNNYIRVTYECPDTASITPKLHLPAPTHEPIHHVQGHSPAISQATTYGCLCSCSVAGPLLQTILCLLLGLAQAGLQMSLQGCACEARRCRRHYGHL